MILESKAHMLLADGSATLLTDADLTDADLASYEALSPSDSGPGLTELEVTVQHLLAAVSRVRKVLGTSAPSERARAELARARYLLETLGVGIAARSEEAARIADDGTWFETTAGRVDVARRGAIRRILAALAAERTGSPGHALGVGDLFAIGWPGEKIPYESQVRRVYTAIWTLRTLGLDGLLITRDEGYLLDPKQPVALAA
jgi:hypothetical protein